MSPEIGSLCLFVSFALALVLCVVSVYTHNLNVIRLNTVFLFITITVAFFALISAHALSDFTVLNVYLNSHTSKPLIYKISGAWGNHEGSMLLWLGTMALFTMLFSVYEKGDRTIVRYTICIQGLLLSIFLVYVIYGSNPFERLFPPPKDGLGLNAILQDIGLALHPPVLYLGYVGFSLGFSIAVASLFHRKLTKDWPEIMRPWILLSWIFLTAGISLGSWWAYRELGWGGERLSHSMANSNWFNTLVIDNKALSNLAELQYTFGNYNFQPKSYWHFFSEVWNNYLCSYICF
jgi:cytochrome c-type biogenesis protein CcmF